MQRKDERGFHCFFYAVSVSLKINLNTAFAEDEPQTEEDRIAADIMSANGNTVDFTA